MKLARIWLYLRNRSALAVNCCVIIHCLEVSCKEDQSTSAQRMRMGGFRGGMGSLDPDCAYAHGRIQRGDMGSGPP